jgi:hypothetical protein
MTAPVKTAISISRQDSNSGFFLLMIQPELLDSPKPVREVEIPRGRPAGETPAYSLEENALE